MVKPEERLVHYSYFLNYPTAADVKLDQVAQNAGISVDSAKALKGKLMTSPTIYNNLVAGGYDPEKIPAWVARTPHAAAVAVAEPVKTATPVPAATPITDGSTAVADGDLKTSEKIENLPIGKPVENPGRMLPTKQPPPITQQPQPINIRDHPQATRTFKQPSKTMAEKPGIVYIEGKPAVELEGGLFRWATQDDIDEATPPQSEKVAARISQATLQEVEVRTQAIMNKVALNPSNVTAHAFLANTIDPDTNRAFFEGDFGDFVNWAINYAVLDAYGLRVGIITTGRGKYQQMKQQQKSNVNPQNTFSPNTGGNLPFV